LSHAMRRGGTREGVAPMHTQKQFCHKSLVGQESRQVVWRDSTLSHANAHGATREEVAPDVAKFQYRRSSFSR
jgi:hypothetical protein